VVGTVLVIEGVVRRIDDSSIGIGVRAGHRRYRGHGARPEPREVQTHSPANQRGIEQALEDTTKLVLGRSSDVHPPTLSRLGSPGTEAARS